MLDKFNGVIYLSIFIVHFIVYAVYAFRTVVATKSFLDQYNICLLYTSDAADDS